VFSRDCAEYQVALPSSKSLWVLCNHFKSKGYGSQASNDRKRAAQAARVTEIVARFDLGSEYVAVAGDFNDTPDSAPLKGLLKETPGLHDVLDHLSAGQPRWTYGGKDQIDYLLVSDAPRAKIDTVGIEKVFEDAHRSIGLFSEHFPGVDAAAEEPATLAFAFLSNDGLHGTVVPRRNRDTM
jgi:predicted extracellular nuclease